MIIILFKRKIKRFSQNTYNNIVHSFNKDNFQCPNPNCLKSTKGCLHYHGTYKRTVLVEEEPEEIKVLRLKCYHCKMTHAILIAPMIPYSQNIFIAIHPYDSSIIKFFDSLDCFMNTCFDHARNFMCIFYFDFFTHPT